MQDELARPASPDDITNALTVLAPANLAAVAGQITHSIDHYRQFVTNAYQQYLGRNPDESGLGAWVTRMPVPPARIGRRPICADYWRGSPGKSLANPRIQPTVLECFGSHGDCV